MMKFIYPVLFFLELTALIFSIAMNYLKIRAIEPVYWNVFLNDISLSTYEMLLSLLVPALLTFLAFRSKKIELICQITKRGTVLLLLLILLFVPLNFTSIIAFILICVIAFFRILSCFSFAIPECQLSGRKMAVLAVAGGVAGAVYGSFLQFYDVYRLALANSDWGVYVVAYKELASGLFNCPIWKFLNTGGHFNLLPNIFGTLLFSVTPEPFAIFILNSLVIYSAIPCTYFAARSNKVAPLPALIFSLALLFHFTLANLNTCIFYGYHPNIYLIPLFLLFWGFFCQKRYRIAAVFMLLSLLVQETFAVLWFGFGLFLLLFQRKNSKSSELLSCCL